RRLEGSLNRLSMDVSGFSPAELMVRVDGRKLTVTGKHEKKTESEAGVRSQEYREIRRETLLPEDVNVQAVLCSLSQDGQLCIEAPRLALPAAQGRDIPITAKNPPAMMCAPCCRRRRKTSRASANLPWRKIPSRPQIGQSVKP
uniref:SHSP domain-containing protein n=1 Tax=Gopherus agassizii TaxID=38772 RepID=A0A452H2R9_9SAUR